MNIRNKIAFIIMLGSIPNIYCESYTYQACKFYLLTCMTGGIYPAYKIYKYFKEKSDNELILESEKLCSNLNSYYKSSLFMDDIKNNKSNTLIRIKEDLEKIRSLNAELNQRAFHKELDSLTLQKLNNASAQLIVLMQIAEYILKRY